MSLESGNKAPQFSVKNQDEKVISLTDLKGKNIVLYFYPKIVRLVVLQSVILQR